MSDSPYLHAFDGLEHVYHQMAEQELQNSMNEIDYQLIQLLEYQLPNGKKLVQLGFCKKSNREKKLNFTEKLKWYLRQTELF